MACLVDQINQQKDACKKKALASIDAGSDFLEFIKSKGGTEVTNWWQAEKSGFLLLQRKGEYTLIIDFAGVASVQVGDDGKSILIRCNARGDGRCIGIEREQGFEYVQSISMPVTATAAAEIARSGQSVADSYPLCHE